MPQEMFLGSPKKLPHFKQISKVVKNFQLKVHILNIKLRLIFIPHVDR